MSKLFITTVGTSLFTNMKKRLIPEILKSSQKDCNSLEKYFKDELSDSTYQELKQILGEKFNSYESAEISTLEKLLGKNIFDPSKDSVLLLYGNGTHMIAEDILNEIKRRFHINQDERVEEKKHVEFDIKNLSSFEKLWVSLTETYEKYKDQGYEIILVASGGYKIISDLVYLFSLIYGIPAYYSFEKSDDVYKLPNIPVNWDYVSFVAQSTSLSDQDDFLRSVIRSQANEIKKHLLYSDPVVNRILIFDKRYRSVIEENLPKWQNLWIGDLIPETVEHSKSHSKRILQRFEKLVLEIGEEDYFKKLSLDNGTRDKYLFYLYVSAYLHDIGHTVMEAKDYDFSELPEIVREYHNILSVYAIENWKEMLGLDKISEQDLTAIKLVCLYHRKKMNLAKKMTLESEKEKFGTKLSKELLGFETNVPLIENSEFRKLNEKDQKIVLQVAAMLKFLDELDVQADRVIDDFYMAIRLHRTKLEAERILKRIPPDKRPDEFQDASKIDYENIEFPEKLRKEFLNTLYNTLNRGEVPTEDLKSLCQFMFKIVQFQHFKKHSSIEAVIPSFIKDIGLKVVIHESENAKYKGSRECKADIEDQIQRLNEDQEFLKDSVKFFPVDFADELIEICSEGGCLG